MIRPVPETPPFPTKEDWAYILMALGTLHNMQPYYRVEAHVATLAAAQGTARQLEYWQTCSRCGEKMDAPGNCSNANTEQVEGLVLMHEETMTRAEKAEAAYAALREQAQALVEVWRAKDGTAYWGEAADELEAVLRAGLQGTT